MWDGLGFPELDLLPNVLLHGTTCISWRMVASSEFETELLQRSSGPSRDYAESV